MSAILRHQVKTSTASEVVEGYSVNLNCSHPGAICAVITCPSFPLWSQVSFKMESKSHLDLSYLKSSNHRCMSKCLTF